MIFVRQTELVGRLLQYTASAKNGRCPYSNFLFFCRCEFLNSHTVAGFSLQICSAEAQVTCPALPLLLCHSLRPVGMHRFVSGTIAIHLSFTKH